MADQVPTSLINEDIPGNYFVKNHDRYREEPVDNNSYIILAILIIIAGFVALAAFVLINMR